MQITYFIAFTTGILSFLAPCVLPLLPAYISMVSGISLSELQNKESAKKYQKTVVINSLFYIIGFTIVFTLIGLSASTIGNALIRNKELLSQLGGIFIIIFGLMSLGAFRTFATLNKTVQVRFPEKWKHIKLVGPFLMGVTFALAWTPCVGAILGAIITLAASSGSAFHGTMLLIVYSLGISLPFLLISLTISTSYPLLKKIEPKLELIHKIGAILIILTGFMLVTGYLNTVSKQVLTLINDTAWYQALLDRL